MASTLTQWMRTCGKRRVVRAGATLVQRGAEANTVLLVERGSVILERHEADGNQPPVTLCGQGALVGLAAAILEHRYDVTATSRTESEVFAVDAALVRGLTETQGLGVLVARALAHEARALTERCVALQSKTVRERVLAVLAAFSETGGPFPVRVHLRMQELAVLVGADQAHVCRVMRSLRDEGLVEYARHRLAIRTALPVRLAIDA
ncbi:MAG TPA: Crp/Fnr family transcriptional regulator [Jiangellaceae bacterium]|nr:Crp/Fnr family transcriptional regulator [Jiangellaceae bacterium]